MAIGKIKMGKINPKPKPGIGRPTPNPMPDKKKSYAGGKKKLGGRKISNMLGISDPNRDKVKGGKKLLKQYKKAVKTLQSTATLKTPKRPGGR